jgi:hypothetical protein
VAFRFTSAHLAACLPHMPQLTSLELSDAALDSFSFLSSGPITRSLKSFVVISLESRLPLSELAHVHALSSLLTLILLSPFDRRLDEHTERLYHPPSVLMPSLGHFFLQWEPVKE